MQKLAVIRRRDSKGNVRDAAVNVAQVRYVFAQDQGSYITFEDEHSPDENEDSADKKGVTPIGMDSPDSVEEVIRRLNEPYWTDLRFKVGGLLLSALAVMVTIWLSSANGC